MPRPGTFSGRFLPNGVVITPREMERAEADQIRTVVAGNPSALGVEILGAFLVALTVWIAEGRAYFVPWLWWILLAAGLCRGVWVSRRFNRSGLGDREAIRQGRRMIWETIYCAVTWGSLSWLMIPAGNPAMDSFLIIVAALAVVMGGASQAVYRPFLLAFVLPTIMVFAAGLLKLGDFIHVVLGMDFILAGFFTIIVFSRQEKAVKAAILLRHRTEKLLEEKTEQQKLTDKARSEAEQAREEAERANQGKTAFLAAASHDLRQPMHALVQYFGHLKRRNEDPRLSETIDRIGKSLDAIQDLLDSILEVSKLMMRTVKPSIKSFPVSEVLDRVDVQLRPLAEEKGLEFHVAANPSIVRTDEILLERILRNIVLNAIRYTNSGRVLVRCKAARSHLGVQVWDTGIGIRQEELGRIFEEFYQVENEARDQRKGLGLGLFLVRQLCFLLQCRVRVRSTFGKGTVFMVRIPLSADDEACAIKKRTLANKADHARGAFVVLIDDNEASLDATAASLREFGCKVLSASSGPDAVERLQAQELMPQLIISDYRLGGGQTGIDAIRMVIENQRATFGEEFSIPALLVSGDTAPNGLHKVHEAGYLMLHKPVKLDLLYESVNDRLEQLANPGGASTLAGSPSE